MIDIEVSGLIHCPLERVFAYTVNSEHDVLWQMGVITAVQTSPGPVRSGTTFRQQIQFMGRTINSDYRVIACRPNELFMFETVNGPIPAQGTFYYEATGESITRFTIQAQAQVGDYFKFAEPLVGRVAQRQWHNNFATLKEILETGG